MAHETDREEARADPRIANAEAPARRGCGPVIASSRPIRTAC